jgi:Peptidase family M23
VRCVRSVAVGVVGCLLSSLATPALAQTHVLLIAPVDASISRPFESPQGPYGPGHRGIDYAVPQGTRVRAAASGRVTFAGSVAGSVAVTIQHEGGVRTTYSVLSEALVRRGDPVRQGQWVGLSATTHPGQDAGLHFGVKLGDVYVDPATMLGAADVSEAIHLAPLAWRPAPPLQGLLPAPPDAGDYRRPCSQPAALSSALPAPDRNIAVAVAGIGSRTAGSVSADLYEYGPDLLGYRRNKIFSFSYRGIHGPRLHEPYSATDTYGDLKVAAHRLRRLMIALGRRYPGVDVDLFAHSQGGLVARLYLETQAAAFDPRLPRVDHLVTLAAPNQGAPLARLPAQLGGSVVGDDILRATSRWSRSGGSIPDPLSRAVAELAPGSPLLEGLARQDVSYGTQVLTLASPLDVVVPPKRAAIPGKLNRVVPPNGLFAHSAIVRSDAGRRIEYSFLRGGPVACRTWWDHHGPQVGAGIKWVEGRLGGLVGSVARGVSTALRWGSTLAGKLRD